MGLPSIQPTGAMSSGTYVEYMINYLSDASGSLKKDLDGYWGQATMTDWSDQWTRITNDLSKTLVSLQKDINIMNTQLQIIGHKK